MALDKRVSKQGVGSVHTPVATVLSTVAGVLAVLGGFGSSGN